MILHRVSADYISDCKQNSDKFFNRDGFVRLKFNNFTNKSQGSDFEISIEWADVEAVIIKFAEAGHPEALRLTQARSTAAAIVDLVKMSV